MCLGEVGRGPSGTTIAFMNKPQLITLTPVRHRVGFFSVAGGRALRGGKGEVDLRTEPIRFRFNAGAGQHDVQLRARMDDLDEVLREIFARLSSLLDPASLWRPVTASFMAGSASPRPVASPMK